MSRIVVLLSLTAVVAMGVAGTSAYASPVWLVKGKVLESSETSLATVSFGKMAIKWEDSATKEKFEAECKKASGEAELKGGETGTDKLQALKLKECSLVKAAPGCELTFGAVTTEELPGWSTKLEVVGETTYDVFTGVGFSLILEGCEKASFSKTWLFRGTLKAEVKNESGKIKAALPPTAVEGDTLKSEGAEALLSGEGKMEDKGGGTLEVVEKVSGSEKCFVMPCYLWAGGELVLGSLNVLDTHLGNSKLTGTLAGVGIEIVCTALHGTGTIENSVAKGTGLGLALLHYTICTMAKPAGQNCLVKNELFHVHSHVSLLLAAGGGAPYAADFVPESGATFASITIDNCTNTGLNNTFKINGSMTATVNNANSELEFTKTSGSKLTFGGNPAEYVDTVKTEMEGGGAIKVGNGS